MLITPSKCPVCGKMSVYTTGCENCWYISSSWLEYKAQWTRDFLKCWDVEKQQFKPKCLGQKIIIKGPINA